MGYHLTQKASQEHWIFFLRGQVTAYTTVITNCKLWQIVVLCVSSGMGVIGKRKASGTEGNGKQYSEKNGANCSVIA